MRGLWGDRRGVTIQVGAILLFGIAIIALSTYQAVAVPIENEQVEFNHNQAVQQDMLELRSAILGAGTDTTFRSVPVQLGTTYPPRVLLVNPPPPSGRLEAGSQRNASIGNITATDNETDDFLNTTASGPYNLSTRAMSYSPSYSEYDSAPTTTVEVGVAVNENPRGNDTALTDQTVVEGTEITLVTVTGNLSAARSGTVAVDPKSLSASTRATTVTNTSAGNLTVTVPTTLSAERWRALLDGEGRINSVSEVSGRDAVRLSFDGGVTYRLRTALVGVGSVGAPPGPAYITAVDGDDDVTIETRDRYNNPVPNSRVEDTLFVNATENRTLLADPRIEVDEDGRAEFAFDSTATSDDAPATLNFTLENGGGAPVVPDTPGNVTVVVEKSDLPAGGGGGGGGGGGDAAGSVSYVDGSGEALDEEGGNNKETVKFTVKNSQSDAVDVDTISVDSKFGKAKKVQFAGENEVTTSEGDSIDKEITLGGGSVSFSPNATLPGNSDTVFTLRRFQDNKDNDVDISGKEVTVTLGFADGTTLTFTFTATD